MKPWSSTGGSSTTRHADPMTAPQSVRKLRLLGEGRAAQAVLVEAVMPDGRKQVCVEKVFSAGWLTRTIYRLSFQAPFAYQSNRDAIMACFYRRRVAAAVLEASDSKVRIAEPLYVRFDQRSKAWVLAAKWVNGRGIKPAPSDRYRLRRFISREHQSSPSENRTEEIQELVQAMHQLEELFSESGLTGSGWQVAPRALVSTANLLRQHDQYTVIDLESGIPAVLVPKYLLDGARRAELPPFDDLDEVKLRSWFNMNERLLVFRLGTDALDRVREDIDKLIEHAARWKASELALLRRPWRLFRRDGMSAYQTECVRRWEQDQTIDSATSASLSSRRWKSRLIWYAGLVPGFPGRFASRLIGHAEFRRRFVKCLRSRAFRKEQLIRVVREREARWIESQRLSPETRLTPVSYLPHRVLEAITPRAVHRFVADRQFRSRRLRQTMLLMLSSRYQSWFGHRRIESSINSWQQSERISIQEASCLRGQLSGNEVRAYVRGLGAHMAIKTFAPLWAPAKYGGIAAFFASGNLWFLLPMLLMPALRTMVTLASWWSTRHERIPHGEALLAGLLPTVGSVAFPLQMFAARSDLSVFLMRDAASKLGRSIPIYGGRDSRTEIAMIQYADTLVELLDVLSTWTQKVYRAGHPSHHRADATILKLRAPSRLGRWLDRLALEQIAEYDARRTHVGDGRMEATMGYLEAA